MEALKPNKTLRSIPTTYSTKKLCEALREKYDFNFDTYGRASANVFGKRYDNEYVVYSYGRHFRIATYNFETETWTINGSNYSVSTTRHQSTVFSALVKIDAVTARDIQKTWRTRTYNERAKWAQPLTPEQWASLQDCQDRGVPLRRNLKNDLEWQRIKGITCNSCIDAWNTITNKKVA